jgi:hypothetical protein
MFFPRIALRHRGTSKVVLLLALALAAVGCKNSEDKGSDDSGDDAGTGQNELPTPVEEECRIASDTADPAATEYLSYIGCNSDFTALASVPLTSSIPGATSGKVVMDRNHDNALYFQNSKLYDIHYEFASTHLNFAQGFEDVGSLAVFNSTQYSAADRRFMLGAVTYYEGPKAWTLEIAPYDRATPEMAAELFYKVKKSAYFGVALQFHPTSDLVATMAKSLPSDIPIITSDQIYADIDYQPLNLGETIGKVHFIAESELATDYVGFRDIAVLEAIPNDIAVTSGIITGEFQTPLSHVNVLARNRGTPNMGLRNAFTNSKLKALDGKWAKLTVGASNYQIVEVTQAEADAWWEAHKPTSITLPEIDLSVTELRDIKDVTPESTTVTLRDSIRAATLAFGAKAANYSILAKTDGVPTRPAFAIPIYYYHQFMTENGFFDEVRAMQEDAGFQNSLAVRDTRLAQLREDIVAAPLNADFMQKLKDKLAITNPGQSMRFRTSTNAEDLDGFPCAGCYDSHTGDPNDTTGWEDVWTAIKKTWAGVWFYRTYQEREYHSIDHTTVGMALLVHHNFPEEEANGVAVTANIFEPTGIDPAFYINVQYGGDVEVVAPPAGVTSDEFLYYFSQSGQPTAFISHSSLVEDGATVLSRAQTFSLGEALSAIHDRFSAAYGPAAGNTGWYAMDVEFKFDDEDTPGTPSLIIKQARPYPDPSE